MNVHCDEDDLEEFCAGIDTRHNDVDIGYNEFIDAINNTDDLTKSTDGIVEVSKKKSKFKKEVPSNKKLWNSCVKWVDFKFSKKSKSKKETLVKKRYMTKGGKWKKQIVNEASSSSGIVTGNQPTGKSSSTAKTTTTTAKTTSAAKDSTIPGGDTDVYDFARYKSDNSKYGNSHMVNKEPKRLSFDKENKSTISLKEIVDSILTGK
jgi:hypothetical protein